MKALFKYLLLMGLPAAAFIGGYVFTEHFFRWKLVPYPFERTGIAIGLGSFFWTLALLVLIYLRKNKRGTT